MSIFSPDKPTDSLEADSFSIQLSPERQANAVIPSSKKIQSIKNGRYANRLDSTEDLTLSQLRQGNQYIETNRGGVEDNNVNIQNIFELDLPLHELDLNNPENLNTYLITNASQLSALAKSALVVSLEGCSFRPDLWLGHSNFLEKVKTVSKMPNVAVGFNGCASTTGEFPHAQVFHHPIIPLNKNHISLEQVIPEETILEFHQRCWSIGCPSYIYVKDGQYSAFLYSPDGTIETALVSFDELSKELQLKFLYDSAINSGVLENTFNASVDKTQIYKQVFLSMAREYESKHGVNIQDYLKGTPSFSQSSAMQLTAQQVSQFLDLSKFRSKHITDNRVTLINGYSKCDIV